MPSGRATGNEADSAYTVRMDTSDLLRQLKDWTARARARESRLVASGAVECLEKLADTSLAVAEIRLSNAALFQLARAVWIIKVWIGEYRLRNDRTAQEYCNAAVTSIAEAAGCSAQDLMVLQRAKVAVGDLLRAMGGAQMEEPECGEFERVLRELAEGIGIDYGRVRAKN
jgi:hypothetical protein